MIDVRQRLTGAFDTTDGTAAWAASGAMALTGRRHGPPLLGPASAAPTMAALAARLDELSRALGRAVVVDGPALLGERAAITGHSRQGEVSVGGACRLLPARGGWVAVSLARDADIELVPAWLAADVDGADPQAVAVAVAERPVAELVERAGLLGLPCGALGEMSDKSVPAHLLGSAAPVADLRGLTVVDLSSLWAGPLCGQLLAAAGARVIKVESITRPDGARRGPRAFFELMHRGKEFVELDFSTTAGRAALVDLVGAADVVIEASRPRALEQLGIPAGSSPGRVWLSITGYGRDQPSRVAFGDDAAVAGGLVAYDEHGPVFAADAAADPATGLLAAVAVLDRLAAGGRWLLDVALARTAALLAAEPVPPTASSSWSAEIAPPRARSA
jgi:hypothetical protein